MAKKTIKNALKLKKYNISLLSALLLIGGAFLMLEQVIRYQQFEWGLVNHETYGLAMIIVAFILGLWNQRNKNIKYWEE